MARFSVVENGIVINQVEAEDDFAAEQGWIPAGDSAIGDLWNGSGYSQPPAPPAPVPTSVSIRQARLALLAAGLLDDVEAAIKSAGHAAEIEWEYAADVRRDHPMIATIQQAQGLSDAQVDTLFTEAARL